MEYLCALCGIYFNTPKALVCGKCKKEYKDYLDDPSVQMLKREELDRRNKQAKEERFGMSSEDPLKIEEQASRGAETLFSFEDDSPAININNILITELGDFTDPDPEKLKLPPLYLGFWNALSWREQLTLWIDREMERLKQLGYKLDSEDAALWISLIENKDISAEAYRKRLSTAHKKITQGMSEIKPGTGDKADYYKLTGALKVKIQENIFTPDPKKLQPKEYRVYRQIALICLLRASPWEAATRLQISIEEFLSISQGLKSKYS